jgi:sortase A
LAAGVALILTGLGIVAYNLWPDLTYEVGLADAPCPYPSGFSAAEVGTPPGSARPKGRRLVIPAIGVDVAVRGGAASRSLARGGYHQAGTQDPGQGGNTVVAGHRTRRAFALLYRLKVGDPVVVFWDGVEHDYRVARVFEVGAENTRILSPTPAERLTLYTCTPRFLGNRRTVVWAEPTGPFPRNEREP